MENKYPDDNLKKSATFTKFEEYIGVVGDLKTKLDVATRINDRLKEQITLFEQAQSELTEKNKELRKELRQERERSEAKVELDDFHHQLASVINKSELEVTGASAWWKDLLDVLIEEVENCIRLVQQKQGEYK